MVRARAGSNGRCVSCPAAPSLPSHLATTPPSHSTVVASHLATSEATPLAAVASGHPARAASIRLEGAWGYLARVQASHPAVRAAAGVAPNLRTVVVVAPNLRAAVVASHRTEGTGDRRTGNRGTPVRAMAARGIRPIEARNRPGDSAGAPCRPASPRTRTRGSSRIPRAGSRAEEQTMLSSRPWGGS
jgi:hypothetical protein